MGISISGIDELKIVLQRASKEAPGHVFDRMKREGRDMRDLARAMAPVDVGSLEEAITVQTEGGGRDSKGRFLSKAISVFIDMNAPVEDRPGHSVGEYAYEMHEHLTPYGPKQLGKKSLAKQGGQSVMVGGGFLERAADKIEDGLMGRLIEVARSYL